MKIELTPPFFKLSPPCLKSPSLIEFNQQIKKGDATVKENMKVAVMLDKMKMGWEERPIPAPADNEVLVKIDCVGRIYRKTTICTGT